MACNPLIAAMNVSGVGENGARRFFAYNRMFRPMLPTENMAEAPRPGATEKRTTPATEPVKRSSGRFFTTNREDEGKCGFVPLPMRNFRLETIIPSKF